VSTRDEYVTDMKMQLDALNASMSELEAKAQQVKLGAQATYREGMARLRLQSALTFDKLDELTLAADSSWGGVMGEAEKMRDAWTNSYRRFTAQG
jgi:hypothetical protein